MSESWTILKLLQWTTNYLKSKDLESPRLEAEVLLAHLLNLKRIDLYVQFERILAPDELASFKALLKRRVDHEPLAYIVGKKEFYSRDFFMTPDVLIPRPETEMLVKVVLNNFKMGQRSKVEGPKSSDQHLPAEALAKEGPATSDGRVRGLEIGLGSGCISITLLLEIPTLTMDAIEISEKAIGIARKNAEKHGVVDRLNASVCDFLMACTGTRLRNGQAKFCAPTSGYDFIVSNPPYISTAEMNHLPETVKKFEPRIALEAGDEGLSFYPKIAEFAKNHLKTGGFLAVEIGEDQGYRAKTIFEEHGLSGVEVKKDLSGKERVVVARRS